MIGKSRTARIRLGIMLLVGLSNPLMASEVVTPVGKEAPIHKICEHGLEATRVRHTNWAYNEKELCQQALVFDDCRSEKNDPIYHFDFVGSSPDSTKILVIGVTHGDEPESGAVSFAWADRLLKLKDARNSWRIIPILNPDGLALKSRLNANGVDLNRNFPTKDWQESAHQYWGTKSNKDPRRFPGPSAASERETRCAMAHIAAFSPDFIVSIHTPYGIMDFDGPKVAPLPRTDLPWVSLGHFPGSLGRFMWHDRQLPVLTIELNLRSFERGLKGIEELQDQTGTVALRAKSSLNKGRSASL
jgi:protein MpaA